MYDAMLQEKSRAPNNRRLLVGRDEKFVEENRNVGKMDGMGNRKH